MASKKLKVLSPQKESQSKSKKPVRKSVKASGKKVVKKTALKLVKSNPVKPPEPKPQPKTENHVAPRKVHPFAAFMKGQGQGQQNHAPAQNIKLSSQDLYRKKAI